ncbi:MAG: tetratricopeptide repeat protein [Ignavibacteriae bacterium]|nr:tetratricopeptide repeat protein [Ignavibacteriota bacterium]
MKHAVTLSIIGILSVLVLQGFQCASADFTGAKVYIFQQRDYAKAIPLLEKEVQTNPQNEEAWYLLGICRGELNDYPGMNQAFNEALKISNGYQNEIHNARYSKWGGHLNSGVDYMNRASVDSSEFYALSVEHFQKAISAWPDTSVTYRYLAYAYKNKGDLDSALHGYLKAWEMGDTTESAVRAGLIYISKGEKLKGNFETVNADKIEGVKNLQRVRRNMTKGDVQSIIGKADKVTKGPRGSNKETWTYAKFNLTLEFQGEKVTKRDVKPVYNPAIDSTDYHAATEQFEKAIAVLEDARKKDPASSDVVSLLMQGYIGADKINEAIATFRSQLQKEPGNKQNHYVLGVLLRSAGNFEEAIASFQEALKIDPEFVDASYDIGATYYNWGVDIIRLADEKGEETTVFKEKFEKALPYMEKVSQSEERKNNPEIWETLGTIYARLGKTSQATKAFEKADSLRAGN